MEYFRKWLMFFSLSFLVPLFWTMLPSLFFALFIWHFVPILDFFLILFYILKSISEAAYIFVHFGHHTLKTSSFLWSYLMWAAILSQIFFFSEDILHIFFCTYANYNGALYLIFRMSFFSPLYSFFSPKEQFIFLISFHFNRSKSIL